MAGSVALQADLSTLGVSGLGAFTKVLSAITADNVAPMALIQAEQLGNLFLCNGKFAQQMPDLLRQSSSYRMDKFQLMVGWRKNDAPSYLANTAGGQSIALLIACLRNLVSDADFGEICHALCNKMLPQDLNIASPSQLSGVGYCVFAKVSSVTFTNLLANTVTEIRHAYLNLPVLYNPSPSSNDLFLEDLGQDSLIEFLSGLSQALRNEDTILRLNGAVGVAYLATLSLAICPDDTMLTAENKILHQGLRQNIVIEVSKSSRTMDMKLETLLAKPQSLHNVSEGMISSDLCRHSFQSYHRFPWNLWLLETAKLRFMEHGYDFPNGAAVLIASIITRMHHSCEILQGTVGESSLTSASLLGQDANLRLAVFCRQTLDTEPLYMGWELRKLIENLVNVLDFDDSDMGISSFRLLLADLISLIASGFLAVFIDPGEKVTMRSQRILRDTTMLHNVLHSRSDAFDQIITHLGSLLHFQSAEQLLSAVAGLLYTNPHVGPDERLVKDFLHYPEAHQNIGNSSDCYVLYPAILDEMAAPPSTMGTWMRLQRGHFTLNGRVYKDLRATPPTVFSSFSSLTTIPADAWPLKPSNAGKHKHSFMTAKERFECIELRLDVINSEYDIKAGFGRVSHDESSHAIDYRVTLDLCRLIAESHVLQILPPCAHDRDTPFPRDEYLKDEQGIEIWTIGIGRRWITEEPHQKPQRPRRPMVAFTMTKGHPEAQLFSLSMVIVGWRCFLQGDCCMSCAFQRLKNLPQRSLVVLT